MQCINGFLFFFRGLGFILAFLANTLDMKCESMTEVFDKAYEETLKRYHKWIVQKAITVCGLALSVYIHLI